MSGILETIPIWTQTSWTTTSATYASPSATVDPYFYWDATKYDGTVAVYFEAVMKISTTTRSAKCRLYNITDLSAITASEITTTSTTAVRVRSGDISANLTSGKWYNCEGAISATSATATIYATRLIIVQTGTITKTETQIELGNSSNNYNGPGTSYVEHPNTGYFLYTASEWDGTITARLDATLESDGAGTTAYAMLYDTLGNAVSGSEVSSGSGAITGVSSSNCFANLVDGRTYCIRIKETGTSTNSQVCNAKLVIGQTTFTKTVSYYPIRTCMHTATTTTHTDLFGNILYLNSNWSVSSKTVYHEATMKCSSASKTASVDLNNATDGDKDTRSTSSTTKVLLTSGALTITDNTTQTAHLRIAATVATATLYGSHLKVNVVMTAGTNYTLTTIVGAFTLTGPNLTGLNSARNITTSVRTYALTGINLTNLTKAWNKLTTIVGGFTLTGPNLTGLYSARKLTATVRTYALTGNNLTGLVHARYLATQVGTFTLTGVSTTILAHGRKLTTIVGAYTLTGVNALFHKTLTIGATVSNFTLNGISATLTSARKITVSVRTFSLTGISTGLTHAKTLIALPGSFLLSGIGELFEEGRTLTAQVGAFTLTSVNTNFYRLRMLTTSVGSFTLSGINSIFLKAKVLTAQAGSFALTGVNAVFKIAHTLTSNVGSFALTGQNAIFKIAHTLTTAVRSFTYSGVNADLNYFPYGIQYSMQVSAGSFTTTGVGMSCRIAHRLTAQVGNFALTGINSLLGKAKYLTAQVGNFVLTGGSLLTNYRGHLLTCQVGVFGPCPDIFIVNTGKFAIYLGDNYYLQL